MVCSSAAFAQNASAPSSGLGSPSVDTASPLTPSITDTPDLLQIPETSVTAPDMGVQSTVETPKAEDEAEGFNLPGGYGYTPLNFVPGQGRFDRKPISFSTTLQQGYDDNIYSASGHPGDLEPIKGSAFTSLSQGIDVLIAQSRMGLSLEANGGGQYYYDREGDQLTPTAGLNLLFAYKLTPRAQFSAVINGVYTTQPSLTVLNGLIQSNGKGYFTVNSKFDLLYRWSERFSTDTTYTLVNTSYSGSQVTSNDSLIQTLGQSVRYLFSRRLTGVVEGRASQATYDNSNFESNTYYLLAGADITLSRRLAASFRAGGSITEYDLAGVDSQTNPYVEGSLDYNLSRIDFISFNGRYGVNSGSASNQANSRSTRLGLAYNHLFSPKLRLTINVNYENQEGGSTVVNTIWGSFISTNGGQDAISGAVGLEYAFTEKLTVFANYNHFEVFNADNPYSENSRNVYYLGATVKY